MTTQTELDFRASQGGTTQNDRLAALFRARPGEWLPMPFLASSIHAYAVHSRVADLRTLRGMNIEARASVDRATGQRHSFYRYTP